MTTELTPERELRHGLRAWFTGALGSTLLAKESEFLLQGVRRFHGDSMLWLGPVVLPVTHLDRCMVRHRFFGAIGPSHPGAGDALPALRATANNACVVDVSELPFPPGSMDAIVLHHGLDCAADARAAMRESAKVLRPGGKLLLCGFNPYSFWGLRRWLKGWRDPVLAQTRFVSPMRAMDWLAVLGFEVDEGVQYLMFRPPLVKIDFDAPLWQRLHATFSRWHIPLGGVYFVLARKTSLSTSALGRRRRPGPGKLAPALSLPSARSPQ